MINRLDQPVPPVTSSDTKDMSKVDIKDADDTLQALETYQSRLGMPLSPEDDRRILRKIDIWYLNFPCYPPQEFGLRLIHDQLNSLSFPLVPVSVSRQTGYGI